MSQIPPVIRVKIASKRKLRSPYFLVDMSTAFEREEGIGEKKLMAPALSKVEAPTTPSNVKCCPHSPNSFISMMNGCRPDARRRAVGAHRLDGIDRQPQPIARDATGRSRSTETR